MEINKENYRFFVETMRRNGVAAQQIHQLLCTAWEDQAPSLPTVYRLLDEFASGSRTSFEEKSRSGRPTSACTSENVAEIEQLIEQDPRITLDELADETDISHGTVYKIVTVNL
jgi:transposase